MKKPRWWYFKLRRPETVAELTATDIWALRSMVFNVGDKQCHDCKGKAETNCSPIIVNHKPDCSGVARARRIEEFLNSKRIDR